MAGVEANAVSYVVNWQRSDGGEAWHPVSEVQEAATFAEHLRNAEGVESAKIYRLDEVAFAFRPYFRVELDPPPAVEVRTPAWTAPPSAAEQAEADAETEVNGARRGLFGR